MKTKLISFLLLFSTLAFGQTMTFYFTNGPVQVGGGSATNALIEGPGGIYDAILITNLDGTKIRFGTVNSNVFDLATLALFGGQTSLAFTNSVLFTNSTLYPMASNLISGGQIPVGTLFDYRTNDPNRKAYLLWADTNGHRYATADGSALTNVTATTSSLATNAYGLVYGSSNLTTTLTVTNTGYAGANIWISGSPTNSDNGWWYASGQTIDGGLIIYYTNSASVTSGRQFFIDDDYGAYGICPGTNVVSALTVGVAQNFIGTLDGFFWNHDPEGANSDLWSATTIATTGIPTATAIASGVQFNVPVTIGATLNATNFSFGVLDETNLDNPLWMYVTAFRLNENPYNVGRFTWTGQRTIRLQFDALGQPPQLNTALLLYSSFTNLLKYGGWYGPSPVIYGYPGCVQTGPVLQPSDLYHSGYYVTTNTGGIIAARSLAKAWNVIEVDYLVWPQGSTFTVNTNINGGGTYSPISGTINTIGSGTNVASFFWTNSGPNLIGFTLASTGTGTNAILAIGLWDNTITNGFLASSGIAGNGGDSLTYMVSGPGSNIVAQLYTIWQPDVIFFQDLDFASNMATNLPLFCQMVAKVTPNTKIVFCTTYPDSTGPTEGAAEAQMMHDVARQYGQVCFDGYSPFVSTNVMYNRGLTVGSDWTHMPNAYPFYGYWLNAFLNFHP